MTLFLIPLAIAFNGQAPAKIDQECAAGIHNREAWFKAAGDTVTLPFRDLYEEGPVFVTDQYLEPHGVLFTDGYDITDLNDAYSDGVGLNGIEYTIVAEFDPPVHWVAVDLPACHTLRLFSNGVQILEVDGCAEGFVGAGSTIPIDQVVIYDGSSCPCIDDLHFSRTLVTNDCNGNGVPDLIEIGTPCNLSPDCNGNLLPDDCDLVSGVGEDCDGSGTLDACEVSQQHSASEAFSPFGAPGATVVRFYDEPAAVSDVLVTITVSADLDEPFEFITFVSFDDVIVGEFLLVEDGLLCPDPPQEVQFVAPAEVFNASFKDNGRLDVDVKPTITVDPDACDPSSVAVTLEYLTFSEVDLNQNGIPDACEGPPGDTDGDGDVDFTDLLHVIDDWGDCAPATYCPADVDRSGEVGLADLVLLLSNWT